VPSSTVAYDKDVAYTVSFTPKHSIPLNGYVDITIPAQITVPDRSFTQSSCKAVSSSAFGAAQITCQFLKDQTLRVTSAFRRQVGQANVEYKLVIQGLQNPESTLETSSFAFASFSSSGDPIDLLTTGVTVKMLQNAKLYTVQVQLDDYSNSAVTNYAFTMVPSIPIHSKDGDMIMVTFPPQINLPKIAPKCISTFTSVIKAVQCSYDPKTAPNTVRVDLSLVDPGISPMDRFTFTIMGITNSQSLKTSESIQVNIVS
jgi:hypothetical protein